MLQHNSPQPLYEQIKAYILHRIQTGEFAPDTRLPSERELASQFEVSRVTVSKAIKELEQAGWLYVQIGKGTYIKDRPLHQEITALTSFTEEMAMRGHPTHSRVLRAEQTQPDPDTARILRLAPGAKIVILERVRYTANRPLALECSSFDAAECADIIAYHDFSHESLYAVLSQSYGVNLTHADQTFEARAASQSESSFLSIQEGTPVLAIHRVTFTDQDQPFEVVKSVYRGDRYTFRARLRRV